MTPQQTPGQLARQLVAEFPDGIDADTLWQRCEASGLDMQVVDRAIDDIRYRVEVTTRHVDVDALSIIDLTGVESTRMKVKGIAYWASDSERARYGGQEYLLVREPDNEHDAHAIAVYGGGRKLGYVSASRAALLAPLLDALPGDAFRVGGAAVPGGTTTRLWVDLPRVPALRAYVRGRA